MIRSCAECPQYVIKEIEPELPAFCLYWGEGLLDGNSFCQPLKEGRVPKERVTTLTDLSASSPYGLAGLEYCHSLKREEPHQDYGDASQVGPPTEGRHLVKIKKVRGYLHNFGEYMGPRARMWLEILEGPDTGKLLFDNVSLPHPKESNGMNLRRMRIAYRLGLIPRGTEGTIQINWKNLEGVVCWVDMAYKTLGGRIVPMVDNYELQRTGSPNQ